MESNPLNAVAVSKRLEIEPTITAKGPESGEQALGTVDLNQTQGVAKSIDLPWKSSSADNIYTSGEDNLLGGWGDNF